MTYVIINPGTGPVPRALLRNAWKNARAFRREVSAASGCKLLLIRDAKHDDHVGRYGFVLSHGGYDCVVDMPGCALETARAGWKGLPIPPRLYVNGNSWTWPHAVDVAARSFTDECVESG